jgi:hypothetical protein
MNRLQAAQQFPGADFKDTEMLTQMASLANQGDKEAQENLTKTLENNVTIGEAMGILDAPQRKFLEAKEGRATFLNPDGTVSEEAVIGAIEGKDKIKFGDFRSINKDVGSLVAEPTKIRNAASRLSKIAKTKTATDQLAAIFTFMKALDPTSVVREGEQQQARATGGVTDQLVGFVNRIRGEGALPSEVFENMVATAKRISNQASTDSQGQVEGFIDAFGDRIRSKDKDKLLARVPKPFPVKQVPATPTVEAPKVGGQIMVDAQGNRARVFPDGTIEEL